MKESSTICCGKKRFGTADSHNSDGGENQEPVSETGWRKSLDNRLEADFWTMLLKSAPSLTNEMARRLYQEQPGIRGARRCPHTSARDRH